ncbi:MAG: acetate--CoA ligase family protein [Planctomycetota bacterium]|nr:acetate--CoA ligase family protein [Planctomycetota bacterium]
MSLDALFRPHSVAIIGASDRKLTIGNRIFQNLLDFGFKGKVFPVNPKGGMIGETKVFESITAVPEHVDLVHIVIKNTFVPAAVDECGKKGVKALIINTAGFKEVGGDGIELEKKIVEAARRYGMRIFGPNCQGIMNSDPSVSVYANFTFTRMSPGSISIIAQSGGVAEVVNQRLAELGHGFRMYASPGNACDISIPELLEYLGNDPGTKVIILHIESLAEPRRLMEIASRIVPHKPILGMKTGRTSEGARAVSSHTGGLVKQDTTTEVVFKKCGIVSFSDEDLLCQTAIALSMQPAPAGSRVGIITNTGGPGIISTDECIEAGLSLPDLAPQTKEFLKKSLPPEATIANPVDVLATAGPKEYGAAVGALLQDPGIDSVLINFITPFFVDCAGVAREFEKLSKSAQKPLVGIVMTDKKNWAETLQIVKGAGIPAYEFPEMGARVLAAMTRYGLMKKRGTGAPPTEPSRDREGAAHASHDGHIHKDEATAVIKAAQAARREFLSAKEAAALLSAYHIPAARVATADSPEQCADAARMVGYPVVLKVDSEKVVHKTEMGGVVVGLKDEAALLAAAKELHAKFSAVPHGFIVQEQLTTGHEMLIGAQSVANLGHLIAFGLGGIFVEVMRDVAFGITPLSKVEVEEMMNSIKGRKILEGARGQKGVDRARLADIVLRLAQLVTDFPAITEVDFNPVFAAPEGKPTKVADARIRLSQQA